MSKMKKIVVISMILIIVFTIFASIVFGVSSSDVTSNFSGSIADVDDAANTITTILNGVISATRIIGAAVAIIILMVVASKYIMASAGDRADIKKYAVNYIIGAVILFAATGILGIIQNFVNDATGGTEGET